MPRIVHNPRAFWAIVLSAGVISTIASVAAAGPLEQAIESTVAANMAAARSQKKITRLSEDTADKVAEYRALLERTDSLKVYNEQIQRLVDGQEEEKASLERQIDNATHVGREITPLMVRMLDALEQFVDLDVPFLMEERHGRIAKLREAMGRADITESEKYRRILEAYQVENDYGRTIEAYQGSLETDGSSRTVNFLRIGRISLFYETLDGQEIGMWDRDTHAYEQLSSEYRSAIRKGLRIARKQIAPDLVRIAIPAPEVAK